MRSGRVGVGVGGNNVPFRFWRGDVGICFRGLLMLLDAAAVVLFQERDGVESQYPQPKLWAPSMR